MLRGIAILDTSARTTCDLVMSCSSSLRSSRYNRERDMLTISTRQNQTADPCTTPTAMIPPDRSISPSINQPINRPSTVEPVPVSPGSSTAGLSKGPVCPPTALAPSADTRHPDRGLQYTSSDEQRRYHVAAADSSIAEARCPDSC
jgi:hypothetical protein